MKKLLAYALLLIPITFFSCKNDCSTVVPYSEWTVGRDTFNSNFCGRNSMAKSLLSSDDGSKQLLNYNSLSVYFETLPTVSGTYTVANFSSGSVGASEVGILANSSNGTSYYESSYSIGTEIPAVQATVIVTCGKIKVLIPPIKVVTTEYLRGQTPLSHTTFLSGTLIEN